MTCQFCGRRDATLHFGDTLSFTHGGGLNCCELCATEKQLAHAQERAALIPELEARVEELRDTGEPANPGPRPPHAGYDDANPDERN